MILAAAARGQETTECVVSPPGSQQRRYTVYPHGVLVVVPHKAGSRFAFETFRRVFNCTLQKDHDHNDGFRCTTEEQDNAPLKQPDHVVFVVRDPLERAIAMYNHFAAEFAAAENTTACGVFSSPKTATKRKQQEHQSPASIAEGFERWLGCVGSRVSDVSAKVPRGLEWRHFQPAARYAYADAPNKLVGRVEDLPALVNKLAAKINISGPFFPKAAATLEWHDHALPPVGVNKPWFVRGSAERNPFAMDSRRLTTDERRRIEERIKVAFAADFACFGDVFPTYPSNKWPSPSE